MSQYRVAQVRLDTAWSSKFVRGLEVSHDNDLRASKISTQLLDFLIVTLTTYLCKIFRL